MFSTLKIVRQGFRVFPEIFHIQQRRVTYEPTGIVQASNLLSFTIEPGLRLCFLLFYKSIAGPSPTTHYNIDFKISSEGLLDHNLQNSLTQSDNRQHGPESPSSLERQ